MVDIHHRGECAAPLDVTFAYVDSYDNVSRWMFGISDFTHVAGTPEHGVGSRWSTAFSVKPVKLSSTLEVTDWVENELVSFRSVDGFTNSSTWRFSELGAELTAVEVTFGYELPGGLAGKALGRVFEPVVALSVRESDRTLRKRVAEHYASTRA